MATKRPAATKQITVSRIDQRKDRKSDERRPMELKGNRSPNLTIKMRTTATAHMPASLIMAEVTVCSGQRQFTICRTRSMPNKAMNKPTQVMGEKGRRKLGSEA